jgi:hypothetical protein
VGRKNSQVGDTDQSKPAAKFKGNAGEAEVESVRISVLTQLFNIDLIAAPM